MITMRTRILLATSLICVAGVGALLWARLDTDLAPRSASGQATPAHPETPDTLLETSYALWMAANRLGVPLRVEAAHGLCMETEAVGPVDRITRCLQSLGVTTRVATGSEARIETADPLLVLGLDTAEMICCERSSENTWLVHGLEGRRDMTASELWRDLKPAAVLEISRATDRSRVGEVVFGPLVEDVGSWPARQPLTRTLKLENTAGSPIAVRSSSNTDSWEGEIAATSLAPGEVRELSATVDLSGRRGRFEEHAVIQVGGRVDPVYWLVRGLAVEANLGAPSAVGTAVGAPGDTVKVTLPLTDPGDGRLQVVEVRTPDEGPVRVAGFELQPITPQRWNLLVDLHLASDLRGDSWVQTLDVHYQTTLGSHRLLIETGGTLLSPLSVTPAVVQLSSVVRQCKVGLTPRPELDEVQSIVVSDGLPVEVQVVDSGFVVTALDTMGETPVAGTVEFRMAHSPPAVVPVLFHKTEDG